MLGAIILRDAPKQEARLDLVLYPIEGGFRGFRLTPPGLHYASILTAVGHSGFWCVVEPDTAVVRRFDPEINQFVNDAPETEAHFQQLALAGSMDAVLLPYAHAQFANWWRLVNHIDTGSFPPTIGSYSGSGSRFEEAIAQHHGRIESFLAEMQFTFVSWLLSQPHAPDETAFARWRHLLLACYNAGEGAIRSHPDLFSHLVSLLPAQFSHLPDNWFTPDSFLLAQADYLAEDLLDSGQEQNLPALSAAGAQWQKFLSNRRSASVQLF